MKTKILTTIGIIGTLSAFTFITSNTAQKLVTQHYLNKNISFAQEVFADYTDKVGSLNDEIEVLKKKTDDKEKEVKKIKGWKNKMNECAELNRQGTLTNCQEYIKNNVKKTDNRIITDINLISEPIIKQVKHKDTLLMCGHGKSQNGRWDDNGASFGDKVEREYILDFVKNIKGFDTFGCNNRKSLSEKLEYIKANKDKYSKVIELHYDKRPKSINTTMGPKILFANKDGSNQNNQDMANKLCGKLQTCKTQNSWGLLLLNSSPVPAVIIEIADPNQPGFKRRNIQVKNLLNNLK